MNAGKRKSLKEAYKDKPMVGGVYRVQCNGNQRSWIKATKNLAGRQNKFGFAIATGTAPEPGMRSEWLQYGVKSFSFTVLETLTQKKDQTEQEFGEDIDALLKMWTEKDQGNENL